MITINTGKKGFRGKLQEPIKVEQGTSWTLKTVRYPVLCDLVQP